MENKIALFDDEKLEIELKAKASQSSMKSVKKRLANMSEEELKAWKKKQSEASLRSYKARIAAMTPEQFAVYKANRNTKVQARRLAQKAVNAELNADAAVEELIKMTAI